MTAADPAKKLAALLRRLKAAHPRVGAEAPPEPSGALDPLLSEFLCSFLVWEAGPAKAAGAFRRLVHAVVDFNELRVCLPNELAAIIGERYPLGLERASRLRAALNSLYRREHCVTLARLAEMPKREARLYLGGLDGVPSFVAARVMLLAMGGHDFPLDQRLHAALAGQEALPADLDADAAAGWVERQVRAGELAHAYLLIEEWASATAGGQRGKSAKARSSAKPARRGARPVKQARRPAKN